MRLIFQDGYNFDCNACGRCCRGWNTVHVDAGTERSLKGSAIYETVARETGASPFRAEGDHAVMALRPADEACVFLAADHGCRIHRELGGRAKPLGCQQFPFIFQPTPEGVYVGLSFCCDAVAKNEGRPAAVHEGDVVELLDESAPELQIHLDLEIPLSWDEYKAIEAWVVDTLQQRQKTEDALWHCLMGLCARACGKATCREVPRDEILQQLEQLFTMAVVGVLEAAEPKRSSAITQAALRGGVISSRSFGRDIDLSGFAAYRTAHPAPWKEAEFRRWIDHLIFRKFLIGPGPVLHNLSAMYTAWNVLDFYFYLGPYQMGDPPAVRDAHRALDIVEQGFTAHTRSMWPFFKAFAGGLMEQVRGLLE